jgi:hypothetical protein
LQAEADENTCRKDFTPEEAGRIFQAMLPIAKKMAQEAADESHAKAGNAGGRGRTNSGRKTFPTAIQDESKRAASIVAQAAGMSRTTAEKIVTVLQSGNQELIAQMNANGKVNSTARKLKAKEQRATLLTLDDLCLTRNPCQEHGSLFFDNSDR